MHSSSPNLNCETTYRSPPLNTVIGVRADEASIADPHRPVIFLTGSGFHKEGCTFLNRSREPREGQLWQTFYQMLPPCRKCWSSKFIERWNKGLRVRHRNCAPHVELDKRPNWAKDKPKATVGRPRALPLPTLTWVLSRGRAGLGYLSIVRELRAAGGDVSRAAIQRAMKRKPPYDDRLYDEAYKSNGYT